MKAVFDSDVLIDYLQGRPEARAELSRYEQPHYSLISLMELLAGAGNEAEQQAVEALLGSMQRIEITGTIARRAVTLRQTLRLKLPDAIILASAAEEACPLVTRNRRDFPAHDPRVRFPYEV